MTDGKRSTAVHVSKERAQSSRHKRLMHICAHIQDLDKFNPHKILALRRRRLTHNRETTFNWYLLGKEKSPVSLDVIWRTSRQVPSLGVVSWPRKKEKQLNDFCFVWCVCVYVCTFWFGFVFFVLLVLCFAFLFRLFVHLFVEQKRDTDEKKEGRRQHKIGYV